MSLLRIGLAVFMSIGAGLTLAANVRVDDGEAGTRQESPYLWVGSGGVLHVVWADQREGAKDVRYARSTDSGSTWSASSRVNDAQGKLMAGFQNGPQIRSMGTDTLVVTWTDTRDGMIDANIYVAHSVDAGAQWSVGQRINDDTVRAYNFMPSMDVMSDGSVVVAWLDERGSGSDIMFSRSRDLGATWSPNVITVTQSQGEPCDCCLPQLVAGPGASLILAFRNNIENIRDMYLVRSSDSGAIWSSPTRISEGAWRVNGCPSSGPTIAVHRDKIVAAWMDKNLGRAAIWADGSVDRGETFGADLLVHDPGGNGSVNYPVIADGGSSIYLAYRSSTRDLGDIALAVSGDGGLAYDVVGYLNDDAAGPRQEEVDLRVDDHGDAIAVWTDYRFESAGDIYFGRGLATSIAKTTPPRTTGGASFRELGPNPFNPELHISFELDREGRAILTLYDERGHRVRELWAGRLAQGLHQMRWDGRNDAGSAVATGTYVVSLRLDGERVDQRRVVLVK